MKLVYSNLGRRKFLKIGSMALMSPMIIKAYGLVSLAAAKTANAASAVQQCTRNGDEYSHDRKEEWKDGRGKEERRKGQGREGGCGTIREGRADVK